MLGQKLNLRLAFNCTNRKSCISRAPVFEPEKFGDFKTVCWLDSVRLSISRIWISESGGKKSFKTYNRVFFFLFSHMHFHSEKLLPHASFFSLFHLIKRVARQFSTVPVFPCRSVFAQGFFFYYHCSSFSRTKIQQKEHK